MFLAPIPLSKVAASIYSETTEKPKSALPYLTIFGGLFVSSIFFFVLQILLNGSWAIGLFFYLCFCCYTARLRMMIRKKLLITGHPIEDFLCSILLYPSVTMQLEMTINLEKDETAKSKDVELNTVNWFVLSDVLIMIVKIIIQYLSHMYSWIAKEFHLSTVISIK